MSNTEQGELERSPTITSSIDPTAEWGTAGNTVDPDDLWDVLRNNRRRWIIHQLSTAEEVAIGPLSTHRAAIENDCAPSDVTSDQRKTLYVTLYQNHLPILKDAGVIVPVENGHASGVYTRGPMFVRAHAVMEYTADVIENGVGAHDDEEPGDESITDRLKALVGGSA